MNDSLTLYHAPMTCSRVTMTALEEIGIRYDVVMVNLMAGEQRRPAYRAINRAGKVPALKVGDRMLTENVAILSYLGGRFPDAGLLPLTADPVEQARMIADLLWCSATLHPLVRSLRFPGMMTLGDPEGVKAKGVEMILPVLTRLEERFAESIWWYGDTWSIVDQYLAWLMATASGGYDLSPFPAVLQHAARSSSRPAFQRMEHREFEAAQAADVPMPPATR